MVPVGSMTMSDKKPDRRKAFSYRGVTVVPHLNKQRQWRLLLGPLSWVIVNTKDRARVKIDRLA